MSLSFSGLGRFVARGSCLLWAWRRHHRDARTQLGSQVRAGIGAQAKLRPLSGGVCQQDLVMMLADARTKAAAGSGDPKSITALWLRRQVGRLAHSGTSASPVSLAILHLNFAFLHCVPGLPRPRRLQRWGAKTQRTARLCRRQEAGNSTSPVLPCSASFSCAISDSYAYLLIRAGARRTSPGRRWRSFQPQRTARRLHRRA